MADEPKRFASSSDFLIPTVAALINPVGYLRPIGTFSGVYDGRPECPCCLMRFSPLTSLPAPYISAGGRVLPICDACAVQLLITE